MSVVRFAVLLVCCLAAFARPAGAQNDGKLQGSAQLVREHLKKIKEQYKSAESYGKQVAQRAAQDGKAETYECPSGNCVGAKKHPWLQGNSMSWAQWVIDGNLVKQYNALNFPNWKVLHACFEFGLLGHSYTAGGSDLKISAPEGAECQMYCRVSAATLPWCWPHAFPPDVPPWVMPKDDNGSETAMYWFPEYEISTNNYGINRVNPKTTLAQPLFDRQALLGAKQSNDQKKAQAAGQTYEYDASSYQPPQDYNKDPLRGQGWAGFYFPDFQEKRYAHIYRTQFSVGKSDLKKNIQQGWELNPQFALLDSFPKKSTEHAMANVWTEYDMFDLVSGIPELSRQVYGGLGDQIMTALVGEKQLIKDAAKEKNPFWKNKGAMAYRVATWGQDFGDLEKVPEVTGSADKMLDGVVYKGGNELYPLVSNLSGFGTPVLSAAAIIARRGIYLAGDNIEMVKYLPKNVPEPRPLQYTMDKSNKKKEIDKLNMIRPLQGLLAMSECFRSQNILNMVNADKSLEQWGEKNLPRDLLKYTLEPELIDVQGNEPTFVYWNRRKSCHCRFCGMKTGSVTLQETWHGDLLYDDPKVPLCTYPLGVSFSAWQGKDTYPQCVPGFGGQTSPRRGLDDNV